MLKCLVLFVMSHGLLTGLQLSVQKGKVSHRFYNMSKRRVWIMQDPVASQMTLDHYVWTIRSSHLTSLIAVWTPLIVGFVPHWLYGCLDTLLTCWHPHLNVESGAGSHTRFFLKPSQNCGAHGSLAADQIGCIFFARYYSPSCLRVSEFQTSH